jgi:LacI family transcriptional regulator, repressor for deo operon, udp, cdd, tsx, nupC, and nupG
VSKLKKVTIADVANVAGVSISTVSRVLNKRSGSIPISEETKQIVCNTAKKLGYQADPFASALRTRRSGVIGAIVRDIHDPFLVKVLLELQRLARKKGLELLLGHADYDLHTAGRQLMLMNSRWFDGLLLIGDIPGDMVLIQQLQASNKPFVTVAHGSQAGTIAVNVDEDEGSRLLLDYLSELGHRRIACIGTQSQVGIASRLSYYKDYIEKHNLYTENDYLQNCPNNRRSAAECTRILLNLPNPPTAIFAATDIIAIGAINCAWRMGWSVPDQISICGFDDIDEASQTFPLLTTICQPVDTMAERALDLLVGLIEGQSSTEIKQNHIITPELIIRGTCTSPRTSDTTSHTYLVAKDNGEQA